MAPMDILLAVLVALCFTSFVHNTLEIWGIRQKVHWLKMSMQGLGHGAWPINIDSKAKTAVLHTAIFLTVTGVVILCLNFLNISEKGLFILGIFVLTASYIYTTWRVDQYHSEIESLIHRVKKSQE